MEFDLVIVGGGPAGLMAAARAGGRGRRTLLLEKNRRPGVKILIAGGTRCNLTHQTDARGIVAAFGPEGRFLHSALALFGPQAAVEFFASRGVPTYVEPGGKVFPKSDRSADVLEALLAAALSAGVTIAGREAVEKIEPLATADGGGFRLVTSHGTWTAGKVLLCTGGCSYPACGTTGDGYALAAALGHSIVPPRTALAPLVSPAAWVKSLAGVTLPDAAVTVVDPQREKKNRPGGRGQSRGAVLFTHFGVSGPAPMNVSRAVSDPSAGKGVRLECDFLPDASAGQIEALLDEAARSAGKRQTSTIVGQWLPKRLADCLVSEFLGGECRAAELSSDKRRRLLAAVKQAPIPLAGTLGFKKAEVTAGGVALDEVDSRSMESKIVSGLYFAGEVLDLDGPIGGFNFQAAFSTGYLVGDRA